MVAPISLQAISVSPVCQFQEETSNAGMRLLGHPVHFSKLALLDASLYTINNSYYVALSYFLESGYNDFYQQLNLHCMYYNV